MSVARFPIEAMRREMEVFDNLHPCIRKVLREADGTVYITKLFSMDAGIQSMALNQPHEFARKLEIQLKVWSKQMHDTGMEE